MVRAEDSSATYWWAVEKQSNQSKAFSVTAMNDSERFVLEVLVIIAVAHIFCEVTR